MTLKSRLLTFALAKLGALSNWASRHLPAGGFKNILRQFKNDCLCVTFNKDIATRRIGPMKVRTVLFSLATVLTLAGLALAQNFNIVFYDQPNGTGNVLMTYTGPMFTNSEFNGTLVYGFVLNLGAMSWTSPPTLPDGSNSLNPCNLFFDPGTGGPGGEASITCESAAPGTTGNGLPLFSFCFQGVQWPMPPGAYNIDGANTTVCGNYFTTAGPSWDYVRSGSIVVSQATPTYSCQGFQTPFDTPISIKSATQRAIPLKAQIFDASGNLVTPTVLGPAPAPVVNVTYTATSGTGVNVTDELDPLGQSSSGNVFNFDTTSNTWRFNLATSPFTASGTYTVTLQSGDVNQYSVSPQCSGTFVRQ
jgi:hypothetical protein